ncbi:Dihydrolipoamide acyltransferase [Giardia duodenalis]|uniref:Dihydrolipoamide acyltransferase n=1 Tax=Giardia intestinalis TaxID=5741 RepID=V6T908_GIAIN|nr:Dihydrolipoamide acyltransferase [Giardia intestinalis]
MHRRQQETHQDGHISCLAAEESVKPHRVSRRPAAAFEKHNTLSVICETNYSLHPKSKKHLEESSVHGLTLPIGSEHPTRPLRATASCQCAFDHGRARMTRATNGCNRDRWKHLERPAVPLSLAHQTGHRRGTT